MHDSVQPPSTQNVARRRLLRGSFALPAALAVHNGSALAQASNKLRCMVNAASGNYVYPAALIDPSLGIAHGRVTLYEVPGTTTKYYIKASELEAVGNLVGGWTQPTIGTAGNTGWVRYNTSNTPYKYVNPGSTTPTATNTRVAVLLQASGTSPNQTVKVVGFVKPNQAQVSGVSGAGASCWNSIKP